MNLYLLSVGVTGYDEYDSFVVAAASARTARRLANEVAVAQPGLFLNTKRCSVQKIGTTEVLTEPQVVLGSFNAG